MTPNCLSNEIARTLVDLSSQAVQQAIASADVFVCAAGFEARAMRVPFSVAVKKNPIVIRYLGGLKENDRVFEQVHRRFADIPGYEVCELDLARPERLEANIDTALSKLRGMESGTIVVDISGLVNCAICILMMKIRQTFPSWKLLLFYTEADEYYPKRDDLDKIKKLTANNKAGEFPEYLSSRAVSMFMPAMFSGVTLGHHDTCLIVFAGYEPHRSFAAVEATNPAKLVMVYGEPERSDLKWRLELSEVMHSGMFNQISKTKEVLPTYDVGANMVRLFEYYEHLYDDHVLCVCPINSKIQAVAAALVWETYPDIQLAFPMPTEYLPKRFSVDARETFAIDLGVAPKVRQFI